jgi:hypothetical protein
MPDTGHLGRRVGPNSGKCRICGDPRLAEQAKTFALAGIADREVSRRMGISKSVVNRHRLRHVVAPLQHQLALAGMGAEPKRQREELAAAVASDAPSTAVLVESVLGLRAQTERMISIWSHLERAVVAAETQGAHTAVAALAGQQLKSVEVGSRLAAIPTFVPTRIAEQLAPGAPPFQVNIHFSSTGKTETISLAATPPTIDVDADDTDDPAVDDPGPLDLDALLRE